MVNFPKSIRAVFVIQLSIILALHFFGVLLTEVGVYLVWVVLPLYIWDSVGGYRRVQGCCSYRYPLFPLIILYILCLDSDDAGDEYDRYDAGVRAANLGLALQCIIFFSMFLV